jgi:nitrile hydratase accessory protein
MPNCEILSEDTVKDLHAASARPLRHEGDEAFRIPWELRSFAMGVAYYESDDFAWNDFQAQLVAAIGKAEDDEKPEHYYARWMEALESLLAERGAVDVAELDRRTKEILETPRDDTHQHAHADPVSVAADHGHDHDHDHGLGHGHGH